MVKSDLSMKTERHFMLVLAANRAEDSVPVDQRQVDDDVMQLYKATEGKMGTDEILVCQILTSRNNDQIRAIAHAYKQKFRRDLEDVIKSVRTPTTCLAFAPCADISNTGILWPHGRCSTLPAARGSRQVHARRKPTRGIHGWHGNKRSPTRGQDGSIPLG